MAEFQPYIGPRPFDSTEADRNRFFGRDDEASDLLSCVIAHSTVLLYSQSGAGKTSLINAQLTPMLESAGFEVLEPARVRDVLPDDSALSEDSNFYVFSVLRSWDKGATNPSVLAKKSLSEFLKEHQSVAAAGEEPKPRVVIFDQFEELFTSSQERSRDRENFFDQVGAALEEDRLLRVAFAMREEYIGELDPYLSFLPERLRTRYRLERLNEEGALLAMTGPLRDTEYSFAPGVAEQLVENLLTVPVENGKIRGDSIEPVQLQVVCQTLWENCQQSWRTLPASQPKVISQENLETFGDVDQALSSFYEKAIERVVVATTVKEGVLRRWFEQSLITSAGTRGTEFRGQQETGGIPNAAVDELVNQRIIRAELRGGSRWYELTHDRFISPIKASNEQWLLAHSGGEQTPKRLEARAQHWVREGRRKEDLFDEGELLEAKRWLESPAASDIGYSDALFSLVQASRAASEEAARERERLIAVEQHRAAEAERERAKEQQRRLEVQAKSARRLRWQVAVLILMVVGAVSLSIYFNNQRTQARNEAIKANAEKEEAEELREIADRETSLARQLMADANQRYFAAEKRTEALAGEIDRANKRSQIALANEARALKEGNRSRRAVERLQREADVAWLLAEVANERKPLEEALEREKRLLNIYKFLGDSRRQNESLARIMRIESRLALISQ